MPLAATLLQAELPFLSLSPLAQNISPLSDTRKKRRIVTRRLIDNHNPKPWIYAEGARASSDGFCAAAVAAGDAAEATG